MDIALIRHAEPHWQPNGRHQLDPELTALGRQQADLLGLRAQEWPEVDEVWVSPAVRAQQTAEPLIRALGAPTRTLDWLVEVRQPEAAQGKTRKELRMLFKGWRDQPLDQLWLGHHGGEDLRSFATRVGLGFERELAGLGARRAEQEPHWRGLQAGRIVVVSHAGTSGVALSHLLGVDQVPWPWARFRLGHAAMSVVRSSTISDGHIFELHGFNDRLHLNKDLHTH